jgi:heme-degrading monooxygenase HmoA
MSDWTSCAQAPANEYHGGSNQVIIRIFRAKIRKGRVSDFKEMVQNQSIPWLESSEGMLGYFAGEPFNEPAREFVMVTMWRDLESLQAFVGVDWDDPVVTEDEKPLVESMYADHYFRFDKE